MNAPLSFYASVGKRLYTYKCDVASATLEQVDSIDLPDTVQYVWPHPTGPFAYAVTSYRAPVGPSGSGHHAVALRLDAQGHPSLAGTPVELAHRPIHASVDRAGKYLLVAYSNPSGLTVHPLGADGAIGPASEQLESGSFAHQIVSTPRNRRVILVTRGYDASAGKAEVPGALKCFAWDGAGGLVAAQSIGPNGGYGFGPRHLAFHPSKPWVFVSLERQNALQVFALDDEDNIGAAPLFSEGYLEDPENRQPRQMGGTVHVHPSGRYAYCVNRADHTAPRAGREAFVGGENSVVVFAIDAQTGKPHIIQRVQLPTLHVRTFSIDPSGTLLVAASIMPVPVATQDRVEDVPAALCVYRIGADGRLAFVRKIDVDTAAGPQWWTGFMPAAPGH